MAAARELIDTHGPNSPEVSIRAISHRAQTSAATIYHYFPDVAAVVAAVATEYMDGLMEVIDTAVGAQGLTAPALLDRLVEAYRSYFAASPGLRELWFDHRASPTVVEIHDFYRSALAERLTTAMERYTDTPGTNLDHAVMVTMTGALWELAFTRDPDGDQAVIRKIHQVSADYWERQFGVRMTSGE